MHSSHHCMWWNGANTFLWTVLCCNRGRKESFGKNYVPSVRAKAETVLYPCPCRCDMGPWVRSSLKLSAWHHGQFSEEVVLRLTGYASFPHELSILYSSQSQGKFINAVEVELGLHGKKRCSTQLSSVLNTMTKIHVLFLIWYSNITHGFADGWGYLPTWPLKTRILSSPNNTINRWIVLHPELLDFTNVSILFAPNFFSILIKRPQLPPK